MFCPSAATVTSAKNWRENAALPPSNEEEYTENPVELFHAKELLKRLKKCALSVGDRLETEGLEEKNRRV